MQALYGNDDGDLPDMTCECNAETFHVLCINNFPQIYAGYALIRGQFWHFLLFDTDRDFDSLATVYLCLDHDDECLANFVDHQVLVQYDDDGQAADCRVLSVGTNETKLCTTCELCGDDGVQYDCFFGGAVSDGCQPGFQLNPFLGQSSNNNGGPSSSAQENSDDSSTKNNAPTAAPVAFLRSQGHRSSFDFVAVLLGISALIISCLLCA